MKYLGLDVGSRTIGVAVGEVIATELSTLRASKGESFYSEPGLTSSVEAISQLLDQEKATSIVVGLPVKEDGSHSEESARIENFANHLKATLRVPVQCVDETLTSFMAKDILESQGADATEIEQRIDQVSAQLILQQYLEENAPI